jgi:hypothetical protein
LSKPKSPKYNHQPSGHGGVTSTLVTALICALFPVVVGIALVQYVPGDASFSVKIWGFELAGNQRLAAFVTIYVLVLFGTTLFIRAMRPTQTKGAQVGQHGTN